LYQYYSIVLVEAHQILMVDCCFCPGTQQEELADFVETSVENQTDSVASHSSVWHKARSGTVAKGAMLPDAMKFPTDSGSSASNSEDIISVVRKCKMMINDPSVLGNLSSNLGMECSGNIDDWQESTHAPIGRLPQRLEGVVGVGEPTLLQNPLPDTIEDMSQVVAPEPEVMCCTGFSFLSGCIQNRQGQVAHRLYMPLPL
jgi:hypothetical protein